MRLVLALALLLAACGGGGGSSNSNPAPSPIPPSPHVLHYGYFGIDGNQLAETADHVSFVLALDWGDWNSPGYDEFRTGQHIAQLQEAQARGIKDAWVAVGYLVFTARPGCLEYCYAVRPDAIPRLRAFRAQLQALGLDAMVSALYPVDEPDAHGISSDDLARLLSQIKAEWPAYLAVIYGDTGHFPALGSYDLIGKDKYGAGAGVLQELPPLTGQQRHILVPGGASPWRQDPQPFYDYAAAHADVYAIVPFCWFDRQPGENSGPGIRSNGMAAAYTRIGKAIK